MAAGTLSVTNNSKAVVGVGTTFTAFKAGDFLTLVVGQVPYTVAIASIESATSLTLVLPFDGPTATGLAWDGVKRDTMSLATMGVTVQAQKALRLMIADENNWRAIFGDAEEITVTLPNGQVMQGMSWGYLSQLLKEVDPVEMRNLQQQAETAKNQAVTAKGQAESARDAANTAKTGAENARNQANTARDQANTAKTGAESARDAANTAKTGAENARNQAQGYRDEAEGFKNQINPSQFMQKAQNLNDVADKSAARANLQVFFASNSNLGDTDLNTLNSTKEGRYYQTTSVNATPERNYPFQEAGCLTVFKTGGGSTEACIQEYTTFSGLRRFVRSLAGTTWTAWKEVYMAGSTPTFAGLTTTGTINAGRNSWDGSNWGSMPVHGAFMIMFPDGRSTPGIYITRGNGASGYAATLTYQEPQNWFTTDVKIRARNMVTTINKVGYNQFWSQANYQVQDYNSDADVENFTPMVAATTRTAAKGYAGGVGFGMMTTGGNSWPRAQISVARADRDGSGNFARVTHFRFTDSGNIEYSVPDGGGSGSFQKAPASDLNLKRDVMADESTTAYDNIRAMRFRTFVFIDDEQARVRRGVIAQELEAIDPLYVKHREYQSSELNGPVIRQLELDPTPLLLDTMRALQDTMKKVEELEKELAELKK